MEDALTRMYRTRPLYADDDPHLRPKVFDSFTICQANTRLETGIIDNLAGPLMAIHVHGCGCESQT
jgi:hypothetical protein